MTKARDIADLGAVTSRLDTVGASDGALSNRNLIINGAMQVAQRGTSATGKGDADGYFTCDRWNIDVGVGGDASAGRFTMSQDSSAPSGFANSLKLACTTADTSIASGERLQLQHKIEGQNLQAFAKGTSEAKAFFVSFYVKGNANATYVCELFDLDNGRQCSKTFNVTTDWTRIELSFPADTTGSFDNDNAASLMINIFLHAGSDRTSGTLNSSSFASNITANRAVGIDSFFDSTSRTFYITGVQLEVGDTATPFEHEPYGVTLQKCQRYFYRLPIYTETVFGLLFNGRHVCQVPFPTTMRTNPSASTPSWNTGRYGGGSFLSGATLSINTTFPTTNNYGWDVSSGSYPLSDRSGAMQTISDIDFDAEL